MVKFEIRASKAYSINMVNLGIFKATSKEEALEQAFATSNGEACLIDIDDMTDEEAEEEGFIFIDCSAYGGGYGFVDGSNLQIKEIM